MFRPLYPTGNPLALPVDTSITFRPGEIGELNSSYQVILTQGVYPLGFMDDNKLQTYHRKIVNEAVTLTGVVASALARSNLTASFNRVTNAAGTVVYTETTDYTIATTSGTITRVATGAIASGASVLVSYEYQLSAEESLSSQPSGYDDTVSADKVAVWNAPGIYLSDQYDIARTYVINECLYALDGIITNTTTGISGTACAIGRVHRVPAAASAQAPGRPYPEGLEIELWAHCCS